MNKGRWTPSQEKAIGCRGKNLILSAAAGSGKTDTLTERIIRLIGEGADISRILAVTFTNAAAGELRDRIGGALEKMILENPSDAHAARCLASLDSARISTIHSFFKTEITPYVSKFGLPPEFGIIEEAESLILKKEAMAETVSLFFDSPTDDYEYLCECISGTKSESSLDETLLEIRNAVISRRIDLTASDIYECDFMSSPAALPLKKKMREAGEYYEAMFLEFYDGLDCGDGGKAAPEALRLSELARGICNAAETDFAGARHIMSSASASFDRLSATKEERACECYEYFKSIRTEMKELVVKLTDRYFSVGEDELRTIGEKYKRVTATLSAVLEQFEKCYSAKKREKGCVDYNDLETIADSVFCYPDGSPTPEAFDAGSKFDHILIDEYQDTSLIQDRVFAAFSAGCGRFMVGDVKQSIYGFRGARPELFNRYREKYLRGDGGEAVFLSENFRSDKNIIDFSNLVSDYIFTCGSAPFEKEDRLICKKDGGDKNRAPCDVVIIDNRKADTSDESYDGEPDYVAERILGILSGMEDVGVENVSPSDIAILLRSGKKADAMAKALSARGIPANNGAAEEFFSYGEVLLIMCLINAADNPLRDIYLAGALKSHVFSFTLEDLVTVRTNDNHTPLWYSVRNFAEGNSELSARCRNAVDRISRWRECSAELDALEMLRLILSDTGLLRYGGDGIRRSADVVRSVKTMLKSAAAIARRGGNLHDMAVYFESLSQNKDRSPFSEVPGAVSILTIHKSKGLGFPVCFVCDTSSRFSMKDASKSVLLTSDGSISMKLYDDGGLVKCRTPQYSCAACDIIRSAIEEETRVLYVAMTRAKNKLIVTIPTTSDPDTICEKAQSRAEYPLLPYAVTCGTCYADWILDAVYRDRTMQCCTVTTVNSHDIGCGTYVPQISGQNNNNAVSALLEDTGITEYAREYLENIPAKLTVSALKPDTLNIAAEESSSIDRKTIFRMPEKAPLPRFLQENAKRSATDMGTATHVFMQFCDFPNLRDFGADAELERLISKRFISREDAGLVRLDEIEKFRESEIFSRMLNAKRVLREKRFNALLPAENFTTDDSLREKLRRDGVKITVQGVVDCIFEDEDGSFVLLDYKTDRLTSDELSDRALAGEKLLLRHRSQLTVYRDVCSEMMGRPFDEVYIYSLPLGDVIKVN